MKSFHFPSILPVFAILSALALPAHAGGTGNGLVTTIFPIASGQVFIGTAAAQSQPACATLGWALNLNGTSAVGAKAMLAVLMEAHATGKTVNIIGTGTCDIWGDRESISGVFVN